jgi:hypothetical protein
MGEKKARRARGRGCQGQTPGGGQGDLFEHAERENEACRSEPLFQRPERVCRVRSLGDQEAIRIEPENTKARAMERVKFMGKSGRPTAKDGSLPVPCQAHGVAAANAEGERKGPRCRPPGGKVATLFGNCRLHLVHRVNCETFGAEKSIERWGGERPSRSGLAQGVCGLARRERRRRGVARQNAALPAGGLGTDRLGSSSQLRRAPLDRPDPDLEIFEHAFARSCRFHCVQLGCRGRPPLLQTWNRSVPKRFLMGFGRRQERRRSRARRASRRHGRGIGGERKRKMRGDPSHGNALAAC